MKERQISSPMSSRASSLLRKASGGFEPSFADKTKTRAAIARRVAVGVAAGVAVAAGTKSAVAAPSIAPAALAPAALAPATAAAPVVAGFAGIGFATKFVAAIAIVGTVSAGAVTVHHATQNANRVSATKTAVPNARAAAPIPVGPSVQQSAASEIVPQYNADLPVTNSASAGPIVVAPIVNSLQNKAVRKIAEDTPSTKPATPTLQTGAEVELFQRAQRALAAGDSGTALSLLNEQAQRFPNGAFAEERDAARVLALCGAGRQVEAATMGAAFLSAHPDSISASRVRSSCANGASDPSQR